MTQISSEKAKELRHRAAVYRAHLGHSHGIVTIWDDEPSGWKDRLRDPQHELPGSLAIDESGTLYVATGGDTQGGAAFWQKIEA